MSSTKLHADVLPIVGLLSQASEIHWVGGWSTEFEADPPSLRSIHQTVRGQNRFRHIGHVELLLVLNHLYWNHKQYKWIVNLQTRAKQINEEKLQAEQLNIHTNSSRSHYPWNWVNQPLYKLSCPLSERVLGCLRRVPILKTLVCPEQGLNPCVKQML